MKQDMIEMAVKAGFSVWDEGEIVSPFVEGVDLTFMLEAFAKLVEQRKCKELADKIQLMPFGDTASSFAQWVREQA